MTKRAERIADLFEQEVPEIANRLIQVKEIARKPGVRAKIALRCTDNNLDCVSVCVGNRGERIKRIVNSLNDNTQERGTDLIRFEKVDIFEWSDDLTVLIRRALQPYQIRNIAVNADDTEATVDIAGLLPDHVAGNLADKIELASQVCHCSIIVA